MRLFTITATFALTVGLLAQAAAQEAGAAAMRLFASSADVNALIAKAKAERKPDQANFVQPIVRLAPYTMNLEYRMPDLAAPASVHERNAEIFYVVEGTGTAVTGGKLKNERRTNESNLQGAAIEGGTSQWISKGDVLFVPEKTPHQFMPSGGPLVLMSMHVPRAAN